MILEETLRHASYTLNIPALTQTDCTYVNTSQYKHNNRDNFSTFKATFTTFEKTDRDKHNSIIDDLDKYFSAQRPGYMQKNYTPLSGNEWCKFSSISLPPVNNHTESTAGLLLGLSPDTHGKHRKCYNWILFELYKNIQQHLPYNLSKDFLSFRFHFGIRAGSFRASKKSSNPAYHIHCSKDETLKTIEKSITTFVNENNSLRHVYNNGVTVCPFPTNDKDRHQNSINIGLRLDNTKKKTRGNIRIKIPEPLKKHLNISIIEQIESLQYISTYCFFLDRNKFYLILYFHANPETSQLIGEKEHASLTQYFIEFLKETQPDYSNNTYDFPNAQTVETINSNRLLSMLDDDTTNNHTTTSSTNRQLYYAVSTGRTVGIFNDWAEAHASISGYSHAAHKKIETREAAEEYLANNQGFTPRTERGHASYSNTADMNKPAMYTLSNHHKKTKS